MSMEKKHERLNNLSHCYVNGEIDIEAGNNTKQKGKDILTFIHFN